MNFSKYQICVSEYKRHIIESTLAALAIVWTVQMILDMISFNSILNPFLKVDPKAKVDAQDMHVRYKTPIVIYSA